MTGALEGGGSSPHTHITFAFLMRDSCFFHTSTPLIFGLVVSSGARRYILVAINYLGQLVVKLLDAG